MLEIRKGAVSFDEPEVMELERIIMDTDQKEALRFLKKYAYDRMLHSQQARLKSHLDAPARWRVLSSTIDRVEPVGHVVTQLSKETSACSG